MSVEQLITVVVIFGGCLVALAGLLLAAWAQQLVYKSRAAHYRELVFRRKLEVYEELLTELSPLHVALLDAVESVRVGDVDVKQAAGGTVPGLSDQIETLVYGKYSMYISGSVLGLFEDYSRLVVGVNRRVLDEAELSELHQSLRTAYLELVTAIRRDELELGPIGEGALSATE